MNPGDTTPLKPETIAALKANSEQQMDADIAFRRASAWMREGQDRMWEIIREAHPELDGFELALDIENKTITIRNQKEE